MISFKFKASSPIFSFLLLVGSMQPQGGALSYATMKASATNHLRRSLQFSDPMCDEEGMEPVCTALGNCFDSQQGAIICSCDVFTQAYRNVPDAHAAKAASVMGLSLQAIDQVLGCCPFGTTDEEFAKCMLTTDCSNSLTDPACAYMACLDEETGDFVCPCDEVVATLEEIPPGGHASKALGITPELKVKAAACCTDQIEDYDFNQCFSENFQASAGAGSDAPVYLILPSNGSEANTSETVDERLENSTNVTDPASQSQLPQITNTLSPESILDVADYNKRTSPCPGLEEVGVHGYTSLFALQQDLADYYSSLVAAHQSPIMDHISRKRLLQEDGQIINENGMTDEIPSGGLLEAGEAVTTDVAAMDADANSANGTVASDQANATDATGLDELSATATGTNTVATMTHTPSGTVQFRICPNSKFELKDMSLVELPPLTIETPSQHHPIEVTCIDAAGGNEGGHVPMGSCIFSGGSVHLSIHTPYRNQVLDELQQQQQQKHPITIAGITFQKAQRSSVQMNDPRGSVSFRNCTWIDNSLTAAVISIDGKYVAPETTEPTVMPTSSPVIQTVLNETLNETMTNATMTNGTNVTSAGNDTQVSPSLVDEGGSMLTLPGMMDSGGSRALRVHRSTLRTKGKQDEKKERSSLMDSELIASKAGFDKRKQIMRMLDEQDVPRSNITIDQCSFSGNEGNATIMISSHSDELKVDDQDTGSPSQVDDLLSGNPDGILGILLGHKSYSHSIHLAIKDTAFSQEEVENSIIENKGGRINSSNVIFINSIARSIIRSENGTVSLMSTEFRMNDIKGEEGVVVLDSEWALEENENSCLLLKDNAAPTAEGAVMENDGLGSFSERRAEDGVTGGDAPEDYCEGITSNGDCNTFFSTCSTPPPTPMIPTFDGTNTIPDANMTSADCFSDWDELVIAVQERPPERLDFIICPSATLTVTEPVVIEDSNYITISCGTELSPSKDCVIQGGFSHFHILGTSSGVQLARLEMTTSTGSSIMALGSSGATLNLMECNWTMNEGVSAIIIHNNESLNIGAGPALDIMPMLETETAAMSVGVKDCMFAKNDLSFGAITNIGGSLTVDNSKFEENSGKSGDIVVTNRGSCSIQESCFNASSSIAPGVIFVEEGSEISKNSNNFGEGVTSGGYDGGGSCSSVFLENQGANCLDSTTCSGTCLEFSAALCSAVPSPGAIGIGVDEATTPSSLNDEQIYVPAYVHGEGGESGSPEIAPIAVSAVIGAFALFGMLGIVFKRARSKNRGNGGAGAERSSGGGRCGCLKRRKTKNDTYVDDELEFEEDYA